MVHFYLFVFLKQNCSFKCNTAAFYIEIQILTSVFIVSHSVPIRDKLPHVGRVCPCGCFLAQCFGNMYIQYKYFFMVFFFG